MDIISIFPTHYYRPSDIHLHTSKQEKWNSLTCWLCGQTGHTSSRCPKRENSKKDCSGSS